MTPDKTPTDSEILDAAEDFRSQYKHGGTTFDDFDALAFARAVLAKWGSPVVAVEPVAWESTVPGYIKHITQSQYERFSVTAQRGYKPFKCLSCTTPQPTQAQAGAVPLTVFQIREWWASENGLEDCEMCKITDFLRVVRAVEEKHGIEGGQHAAN